VSWPGKVKCLRLPVDLRDLQPAHDAKLNVWILFHVVVFKSGITARLSAQPGTYPVPGLGVCQVREVWSRDLPSVSCRTPLWPSGEIVTGSGGRLMTENDSPMTAVFGPSPYFTAGPTELTRDEAAAGSFDLIQRHSVAILYRNLDLRQLRLSDYLVTGK